MVTKERIRFPYLLIYLFLWIAINLFFLSGFPFMHTDEAWLASLSRTILQERNPAATESFFNLVSRAPHAIKILFHFIQIIFIKLLGYSVFSIRLFSLLTGAACLYTFYHLLDRLKLPSLPGTILLSLQIQFIYASHFGRQEIIILLLMLLSLYLAVSNKKSSFRKGLFIGLPIALAIGFHPNAFIAAWPAGILILWGFIRKERSIPEVLGFLILPAASALFFVLLSFAFNRGFVSTYGSFGEEVGVMKSFDLKLLNFDDFYQKLFLRVSGTYYTPRIWPVFTLSGLSVPLIIGQRFIKKQKDSKVAPLIIAGLIGVNLGIVIIGKYSAPSIAFVIPFLIILITKGISSFSSRPLKSVLFAILAGILFLNSLLMIQEEVGNGHEGYADFTERIESSIPPLSAGQTASESRILGSLTTEFCFKNGRLLDWRNLTVLSEADIRLEDYIRENKVEYIIYTEEFDLIYRQRPVWNILYGNPTVYHEQLQDFIEGKCELVSEFASPGYGTRIVMHRFTRDWTVRIYRVK